MKNSAALADTHSDGRGAEHHPTTRSCDLRRVRYVSARRHVRGLGRSGEERDLRGVLGGRRREYTNWSRTDAVTPASAARESLVGSPRRALGTSRETEFTTPYEMDEADARSSTVRLDRSTSSPGQSIAYVSDFGDSWHVMLELREVVEEERGARYRKLVERRGEPPPQYTYDE